MSADSERRGRKRKEREREVRIRRLVTERRRRTAADGRRYLDEYPGFVFADDHRADPAFVELIRAAVAKLDFEDDAWFAPWERKLLRAGKRDGFERATAPLVELERSGRGLERVAAFRFLVKTGHVVFNLIPRDELLRFIPYNNVEIAPIGHDMLVKFRCLERCGTPRGTAYFSRHRPTLRIDGVDRIVAFSNHAVERTCERIVVEWWRYAHLSDAFAFFDQCLHFERADLANGHLGFSFYDEAPAGFWARQYAEVVLGDKPDYDPQARYYYRVGYCPAVIHGDFVIAKTLLFPGFRATPEYGKIVTAGLPPGEREQMVERATNLTAQVLVQTKDFSLIKWFHDQGVPQVVRIEPPPFTTEL